MKLLVFSNPSHMGIRLVADAYRKVFEIMGLEFEFFNFPEYPRCSNEEANMLVQWKMRHTKADTVIFFQPSYFNMNTVTDLIYGGFKDSMKMFCVNTEDPYSTYPFLQMNEIFTKKFTNEKIVAEKYKQLGYVYLPLAIDTEATYKKSDHKTIDIAFISTFYQNRVEYLNQLTQLDCSKYIAGNIGFTDSVIDVSQFARSPGIVPHHIELNVYSNSYAVLNPHRLPDHTGKSYLYDSDGVRCPTMLPKAVSPNPRFFDAIGCGCIPMCDRDRIECLNMIKKHGVAPEMTKNFLLPQSSLLVKSLPDQLEAIMKFYKDGKMEALTEFFNESESYFNRTELLLDTIK